MDCKYFGHLASTLICGTLIAGSAFADQVTVNELANDINEVMAAAANGFPSVKAAQKRVEATRQGETALLLNQLSVTGSASRNYGNYEYYKATTGTAPPASLHGFSDMVGARLQLSLQTFFQAQGIELSAQTQQAAELALRMQLAAQAAQAFVTFASSDYRLKYLDYYISIFQDIKKFLTSTPPRGEIAPLDGTSNPLSGASAMESKIEELKATAMVTLAQKESARADLAMYATPQQIMKYDRNVSKSNAESFRLLVNAGTNPVEFTLLTSIFPVPQTPELAFKKAQESPAIVQADLAEKSAKNNWYITLAGVGPVLSLQVSQIKDDTNYIVQGAKAPNISMDDGTVYSIGVSFSIGAGIVNSLNANGLLEEAAKLDKETTEKQINNQIQKLYIAMNSTNLELIQNLQIVDTQLAALVSCANAKSLDAVHVPMIESIYQTLNSASANLTADYIQFVTTRIQIQAMTGTLYTNIGRKPVMPKLPPNKAPTTPPYEQKGLQ